MSSTSEHLRMKPVLDLARRLDIATNPEPSAIFEAGSGGFQVWCTNLDYPQGWSGTTMSSGAFSKPCEYMGSVHWKWEAEQIVALEIETTAYALADQKPDEYSQMMNLVLDDKRRMIFNRAEDIEWLKEKVTWLFAEAGIPVLPFEYEHATPAANPEYALAHYTSDEDEYVVIVSPKRIPEEFCLDGYIVAQVEDIYNLGDFPINVILRPDHESQELDTEPNEGPLVERYENASRLGDDSWLEAAFEDQISGWDEY
jgi:hypothetical protein